MRVLVCGGRDWTDVSATMAALDALPADPTMIIHGDALGADKLAAGWAASRDVHAVAVPALWKSRGRRAGPQRNAFMLEHLRPEYCVAFPGGRGTADMLRRCEKAGIPVWKPYGGIE